MSRNRHPRLPEVAYLTPEFHAYKDHVVAVFWIGDNQSVGIRFQSPEHILQFTSLLMDAASKSWPDNEWIKEYVKDD